MPSHQWTFIKAGGVDQVVIRNGADVVNLDQLDKKLWVALACPTRGIEFDSRTLDLIDTDKDGRIRPPELIAATQWVRERLTDPDELMASRDRIELGAINAAAPIGAALEREARHSLAVLGKPEADAITLDDVRERQRTFAALPLNGDGVVREDSTTDEDLKRAIRDIVDSQGSAEDLNGDPGIDRKKLDAFFEQAAAIDDWRRRLDAEPDTLPLGEDSFRAAAAVAAVADKVEDYFTRTRIAAYDPGATEALGPSTDDYRRIASGELSVTSESVAELPLARIAPERALPLVDGVNPAWAKRMQDLKAHAVDPLLGDSVSEITLEQWRTLRAKLAGCQQWVDVKPSSLLDTLDIARVRDLLSGPVRGKLEALIEEDESARTQRASLDDLEKLARFKRDLVHLLNNFVSFSEFYSRRGAIFEAGRLYLDARSCDLTLQVADAAKHAVLAGLAKAYLVYCECTRAGEKMAIVAAFTAGDTDYLLVGRNGVFYDRKGRDWDATITKVIENPMSIRQAFFSPYKKFLRMIEEQAAKRAAASDAKAQSGLGTLASRVVRTDKPAAAPAASPARTGLQRRIDVGTVAAIGVALGSISAVLVGVFAKLVDLGWWIPVALLGIILAISGPSMVIAWLKLRQRSLGPILDASGWAINGRMRINVPLGASLSKTARIPRGARRRLRDPFAESRVGLYGFIFLAVLIGAVVAWRFDLVSTPAWISGAPASSAVE